MPGIIRFRRMPKPPFVECHFCGHKNLLAIPAEPGGSSSDVAPRSRSQILKGKYKEEKHVVDRNDFACGECGEWNSRDQHGEIRSSHPAMYDSDFNAEAFSKRGGATTKLMGPRLEEMEPFEEQPFCASCLRNQGIGILYRASYDPDPGDPDELDRIDDQYPPICPDCETHVQDLIARNTRNAMKHVWRSALCASAADSSSGDGVTKRVRLGGWRWFWMSEAGDEDGEEWEEWDGSILSGWDVLLDRATRLGRRLGVMVGREDLRGVWWIVQGGLWVGGRVLGVIATFATPRSQGILTLSSLILVVSTRSWPPTALGTLSPEHADPALVASGAEWKHAMRICLLLKILDVAAVGWTNESNKLRSILVVSLVMQVSIPVYVWIPVERKRQIKTKLRDLTLPRRFARTTGPTPIGGHGAVIADQRDPFDLKSLIVGMEHTFAGLGGQSIGQAVSPAAALAIPTSSHSDDAISMDWEPTPPQPDSQPSSAAVINPWSQFSNPSSRIFQPGRHTGLEERFENWSGFSDVSHSFESTESRFQMDEEPVKVVVWHVGVLKAGFMLVAVLRVILIMVTRTSIGSAGAKPDDTVSDALALAESVLVLASRRLVTRYKETSHIASLVMKTAGALFGVRAVGGSFSRVTWIQAVGDAFQPAITKVEIPAMTGWLDGLCLMMDCACWVILATPSAEKT